MGMEGSFPLITLNLDKVVSMLEIDFGEDLSPTRTIEELRDARKGVMVFLCDFVEAPDTESERIIFLLDE